MKNTNENRSKSSVPAEDLLKFYIREIKSTESDKGDTEDDDSTSQIFEQINTKNLENINTAEVQKRNLRDKITKTITKFIWVQIGLFSLVIITIVLSVTVKLPFMKEISVPLATELFSFLKYYIGATIVELLGMYAFILHYVFSDVKLSEYIKKSNK